MESWICVFLICQCSFTVTDLKTPSTKPALCLRDQHPNSYGATIPVKSHKFLLGSLGMPWIGSGLPRCVCLFANIRQLFPSQSWNSMTMLGNRHFLLKKNVTRIYNTINDQFLTQMLIEPTECHAAVRQPTFSRQYNHSWPPADVFASAV